MRRVPTIDKLLPVLYLKGISTGDMAAALESILGPNTPGLSANTIVRLKRIWETEYKDWAHRDLTGKRYVYFWVDGIHFNVRPEEPDTNKMCFLVIMGALENGKKELVAILDGYRESKCSFHFIPPKYFFVALLLGIIVFKNIFSSSSTQDTE